MENKKVVKMAVLDTNVLIDLFREKEMKFEWILKAVNIIVDEDIRKILILDSVYSEIEGLKKNNNNLSSVCKLIYMEISNAIKNGKYVEYSDVKRNENGVDESLIDYCVTNNQLLITSDTRLNIKYSHRAQSNTYSDIDISQIKKVIQLNKKLEDLDDKNLYEYLQKMFDYRVVDTITYIQVNEDLRFSILVNFIIDNTLLKEDENFISKIKNSIAKTKKGKIGNNILMKNLDKLKGYNFGDLKIEKVSLKNKFKAEIRRFLEEKNFSSFEELEKCNPFKKEEELVNGILKYYEKEEGNEQKNY